ncbi:MAG: hypothetical protein B6U88_00220 [Candidatus Aenigmarchaeota archaeon ex4484_56]|nr:MAG: hypothetical protein B6U88_00220 [Candidatus Aenigmarchaeota archaeon ex4484_56]
MVNSKGISPIVASVLLIAFSTAIAAIVGTWAMSYTQHKLTTLSSCEQVDITYLSFNYNSTTKEGIVRLQNVGVPINGYKIYAFSDFNKKELVRELNMIIEKGDTRNMGFTTTIDNIKGITIEVIDCPGIKLVIPVRENSY